MFKWFMIFYRNIVKILVYMIFVGFIFYWEYMSFCCQSIAKEFFLFLFNIVDDLGSVSKYNWGGLVYDYLVESICNALMFLRDKGNTTQFHVVGCVYLLQVIIVWIISIWISCFLSIWTSLMTSFHVYFFQLWSFDHFLIPKLEVWSPSSKFPRILHWMDVKVGEDTIKSSLNNNLVCFIL